MITWNKYCPCKHFTRAYLGIQYSTRIDLKEEAAFTKHITPAGKGDGRGQSLLTFRHCFKNIASYFSTPVILPTKFQHPRDITNKIPALSSILRKILGPSFLFSRSSKVRSSVFHCAIINNANFLRNHENKIVSATFGPRAPYFCFSHLHSHPLFNTNETGWVVCFLPRSQSWAPPEIL
jgi:hypothetical protein